VSESSDTNTNTAVEADSPPASKPATSAPVKSDAKGGQPGRGWELVAYAILYALTVGGILYMAADAEGAVPYWEALIGIVAVVGILVGWSSSRRGGFGRIGYLVRSLLQWGALVLVLYLLVLYQGHLELDAMGTETLLIYVLGLVCFMAGLYLDTRMALFGVFLIGTGLHSKGLIDTSAIDTSLVEGFLAHNDAILIGAAVIAWILTAFIDVFRPKRAT